MGIASIFTLERERDKDNVISDLQSELRRTQAQLLDEKNRRIRAEGELARLRSRRSTNG